MIRANVVSMIGAVALVAGLSSAANAAIVTNTISFTNIGIYDDNGGSGFWNATSPVSGQFTLTYNNDPNVYTAPTVSGIGNVSLSVPFVGQSGSSPYGTHFWFSAAYGVIEVGNTFIGGVPFDPMHPGGNQSAQNFSGQSDFILSLSNLSHSTVYFSAPGHIEFTSSGGTVSVSAVPLPAALPLLVGAIASLGGYGWRNRRRARSS